MPLPRTSGPLLTHPPGDPHMAKVRAKTKKTTKKKVDPLTVSLKLLALADRESMRAIRSLNKAIMSPVAGAQDRKLHIQAPQEEIPRPGHGRAGREDPRGRRRQRRCAGRRHRTPQCVDEDDRGRSRRVRGLAGDPGEGAGQADGGNQDNPGGLLHLQRWVDTQPDAVAMPAVQSDEMGSERPELHQLSEVAVAARSVPGTSHRTPVG